MTRELYEDHNQAFIQHWKKTSGESLTVNRSHGGGQRAQKIHFDDGGLFDRIHQAKWIGAAKEPQPLAPGSGLEIASS